MWVTIIRRPATFESKEKCPGSDSNRHCVGFESTACCQLGYRGPQNQRFLLTLCASTIPQLGRLMGSCIRLGTRPSNEEPA